jgi:hypothetical protein
MSVDKMYEGKASEYKIDVRSVDEKDEMSLDKMPVDEMSALKISVQDACNLTACR